MRNILVHVSHKKRERFAAELKGIWLAAGKPEARQRADILIGKYKEAFPNAIKCLEDGLRFFTFYDFPQLDSRKVSSTNMLERLNREIRRRTAVGAHIPVS